MPRADSPETVNLMPRVAAAIEWPRLISALAVLSSLVGAAAAECSAVKLNKTAGLLMVRIG